MLLHLFDMDNIDAQIYYKKIVDFFENNPSQLHTLIGDKDKNLFYLKIKNKIQENSTKSSEFELSKTEMANLIFELFQETKPKPIKKIEIDAKLVETNFGYFSLN